MRASVIERDDLDTTDFVALVRALWSGRWWIAASTVLLAVLAGIAGFLMTPIYRSSTVLVPASSERANLSNSLSSALGSLGGLAALAGVNVGGAGSATDEAIAVLSSRQFADEFIRDFNLMPVFFASKWDARAQRWKVAANKQPTAAQAFKCFDRKVRRVAQDKKTGLVTLQIDWKDPVVASTWANELVRRLNAEMQRRAIVQADASLQFLEKELAGTSVVETRAAINRLMETQINERMVANVTAQYAFRVVDRAVPADRDDMVRPRKLMMIAVGGFLGAVLSALGVLMFRRPRDRASAERPTAAS